MSLEAMESLTAVEEKLRLKKADAAAAAKRRIAEARADGERTVTEAAARADDEIREMFKEAEGKALEKAKALAEESGDRKAAMRARADGKTADAATFIIERIVNG
ncbi:MAG: hypothetical protein ACI4PC_04685 [Oscillospiraceae bacterium]